MLHIPKSIWLLEQGYYRNFNLLINISFQNSINLEILVNSKKYQLFSKFRVFNSFIWEYILLTFLCFSVTCYLILWNWHGISMCHVHYLGGCYSGFMHINYGNRKQKKRRYNYNWLEKRGLYWNLEIIGVVRLVSSKYFIYGSIT